MFGGPCDDPPNCSIDCHKKATIPQGPFSGPPFPIFLSLLLSSAHLTLAIILPLAPSFLIRSSGEHGACMPPCRMRLHSPRRRKPSNGYSRHCEPRGHGPSRPVAIWCAGQSCKTTATCSSHHRPRLFPGPVGRFHHKMDEVPKWLRHPRKPVNDASHGVLF